MLPRPGTPGSPAHPAHPKSSLPLRGSAGFNATSAPSTSRLGKPRGRGQQLLAGVQPAVGGARLAPCYPRGASGARSLALVLSSLPPRSPSPKHGTRLDGTHGVEMPVPVCTAWRSAAVSSAAWFSQQHGRALAGSLAAPGAQAGAAGAAPLPLPSPASGSTGPTPASPSRGCFPTAGSVPRTPRCL